MDLSIIIVNWNTRELLERCLQSAYAACAGLLVEVIVIDNASTDGSQQMIRDHFPNTILLLNQENVGFARANNQMLTCACGEFVLLLNSDAFVGEDALRTMIDFMRVHPEAGAIGPRLRYPDGSLQRSCTAFPTLFDEFCLMLQLDRLFPHSRLFGRYWLSGWDYSTIREVEVIMGACLMVRRATIEQVGFLDEQFFMYSEEVDWCYRIREAGWHLYLLPSAQAIHIGGGSTTPVRIDMFVQLFRSRVLFFRKHHGTGSVVTLKAIFGLGSLIRVGCGIPLMISAYLRRHQAHPKIACYWQLLQDLAHL